MLPARDFVMSRSGSFPSRLFWGPVVSWVRFHLLSPVMVVGDTWFFRSPGELWVPARPSFFAEMDLASIMGAVRPVHGGVCYLPLGDPQYARLVGVALRAIGWASLSGVCERRSCLTTGGGAEDGLLIVTCIQSGLSWVAPVESLNCVFCIVEVFCGVPDFIVFR